MAEISQVLRRPFSFGGAFCLATVIALIAFAPGFSNQYAYDAETFIVRLGKLPPSAATFIFSPRRYWNESAILSYRPLSAVSMLLLDIHLFAKTAALSHLVSVLLHALNAALLYQIIRRLLHNRGARESNVAATLSAGIMLLHPLVTEGVYCMGFRMDLCAATGVLAGCYVLVSGFMESTISGRRLSLIALATALCTLIGLGFKETAGISLFVLPLAAFLIGRSRKEILAILGAQAAVIGLFMLVWLHFHYPYKAEYLGGGGRVLGITNFLVACLEIFARKLVCPWPLRVDYAFEPVTTYSDIRVLRMLPFLLLFVGSTGFLLRGRSIASLGLVWIAAGFLPVAQVLPTPDPIAERFCYLPMAGVSIAAGSMLAWFWGREAGIRKAVIGVTSALLMVYAALCYVRGLDWQDDITLNLANWERPGDTRPRALESIGALRLMRSEQHPGTTREAEDVKVAGEALRKLLSIDPQNAQGRHLLLKQQQLESQIRKPD